MRLLFVFVILLSGCQQAPTRIKDEIGGTPDKSVVLADTRSSLEFSTFHIRGSVNLNSQDFLVLKNTKTKTRILDPDMPQNIERLAKKGISPLKTIILIAEKKESDESKKWQWFLRELGVMDVQLMSLDEFRVQHKNLRPQPEPPRMPTWNVEVNQRFLEKSAECFVNWSEKLCG